MTDVHADHPETLTPLPGVEAPANAEPAASALEDTGHHELRVRLPVFEGPLDLLLYLIKKDELDIYDIPIERITRQYLEYLQLMKMLDLEVAGEFLVVASTLVYIKSRTLLPKDLQPPEEEAEEDDPRWDLIRQLVEYKKFKDAAWQLHLKQLDQEKTYQRGAEEILPERAEGTVASNDLGIFDLINAFQKVLARINQREDLKEIFEERFTVGDKINTIQQLMTGKERIFFEDLFLGVASRTEIVVTFLALLELIRMKYLRVTQADPFAEIEIAHAIDTTPLFQQKAEGEASTETQTGEATASTSEAQSASTETEAEPERQPGPLAEAHTGTEEDEELPPETILEPVEEEIPAEPADEAPIEEMVSEETVPDDESASEPDATAEESASEPEPEPTTTEPATEPEAESEPASEPQPEPASEPVENEPASEEVVTEEPNPEPPASSEGHPPVQP